MLKMSACCCSPCRPAYKRHVDGIYPAPPEEGLVKNKMESLIYFAMTSPEKLDRIGEYLAHKISRDIYRGRKQLVKVGVEAMDQLLQSACHVRTLNLFVESFLKTIQKLLESSDPDLQILASESFLKFSKIEEETPSYHRTYDFFIDRFSQMCHSDHSDVEGTRRQLRISGLEGLLGVIRKTVNEDLAENIWDSRHMDKIVPSLLFNLDVKEMLQVLQEEDETGARAATPSFPLGNDAPSTPSATADQILRELVFSSSSISIRAVLTPVLTHMDHHSVWVQNPLEAVHTFDAIMYSIQADLSYIVIEQILAHLETMPAIPGKSMVADVLAKIIGIGVGDSTVGPAVLEIINALLKQLEKSVLLSKKFEDQSSRTMQCYQGALLRALGEYTAKMPDFQKTENMTFILSKIPMDNASGHRANVVDTDVQHIFMKALFAVAEKHTSTLFSSTFSTQLLHSLLRLLQAPDPDVRLLVLQTFQILVDRHGNLEKLSAPTTSPANLGLNAFPGKANRADQLFVQKSVFRIYSGFKTVLLEQNNCKEFLDAMYTTVALLSVETSGVDESAAYLLDLIDSMQSIAIRELALSTENRFALHALSIALLGLLGAMVNVAEIDNYIDSIVTARQGKAPHMLPPLCEEYNPGLDPNTPDDDVVIQADTIRDALKSAGKDIQGMDSLPRIHGGIKTSPRSSWLPQEPRPALTSSISISRRPSTVSTLSGGAPIDAADSTASSPGLSRKDFCDEVSARGLRQVLMSQTERDKQEAVRKKDTQNMFLEANYDVLCEMMEMQGPDLQDYVSDVLNGLSFGEKMTGMSEMASNSSLQSQNRNPDVYSIMEDNEPYAKFCPQLFMY